MTTAERALALVLRLTGAVTLLALVPAVMPFAWMDAIHDRWVGLGKLPDMPIMGYLTRSLSMFYAFFGALLLYLSLDVRRYLPVIRFLAALSVLFGAGMLVLDHAVGMPPSWALVEGPFIVVLSGVLWWLAERSRRHASER